MDVHTGERERVSDEKGGFARPSPDGQRLVLATEEALVEQRLDGSARRVVQAMAPGQHVSAIAWSPRGDQLVALYMQGEARPPWLERIDVATGEGVVLLEDVRLVSLGLGAVEWVAPDRLLFAKASDRHRAGLYALTDASTAPSADDAELLRTWEGYQLIRLRAGGKGGLVASRGTARSDVMALTPGRPVMDLLTPEGWNERPVGWTSEGLLMVSNRGGGGVYRLGDGGEVAHVDHAPGYLVDAWEVPGGEVHTWFRKDSDDEPVFEVVRVTPGSPTQTLLTQPLDVPMEVAIRLEAVRCAGARCLVGHAEAGTLSFRWLDATTGERSAPVAQVDYGRRPLVWALSPDAERLAVIYADPAERVDLELATGHSRTTSLDLDLPLAAVFGDDGRLFVAGATFRSLEPYRVMALGRDGRTEVLQSSVNTNYSALLWSPERQQLAVGINAFGTDVWWLELDG